MPTSREKGRDAERLAEAWLLRRGYVVLDRNHATRGGEVDLVCRDGRVLCFVEIRSRADPGHGTPEETVDRRKALRVVAAATDWARRHGSLDDAFAGLPEGTRRALARVLKQLARGRQIVHGTGDPIFREAADHAG